MKEKKVPQFDVSTFIVQFSVITLFFLFFYLMYTYFFLKNIFISIRFRQKLLNFHSKLKVAIKPALIFTELCKSKIL